MAAWLIPALKAVLPHVGTILSVAVPVFTKKSPGAGDTMVILQQQIAELQAAASEHAAHIHKLAEQLQKTVAGVEQAAAIAEKRLRHILLCCLAAAAVSTIALGVALYLILTR